MEQLEKRILNKNITELKKPFKTINVENYDSLYIEGLSFPLKDSTSEKELKEPKTKEQLVDRLREHGVQIDKAIEEEAEKFIFQTNYYKLSIFIRYLGEDKSFDRLKALYYFDEQLADHLSILIKPIEIYLKASLANFLSINYKKYIPEDTEPINPSIAYLDSNIYRNEYVNNDEVKIMLSNFATTLIDKRGKDLTIDHHTKYYGGNIPVWVLVEHLTMGQFGMLVFKLKKSIIKDWVVDCLKKSWKDAIGEWINTIRILRNSCAHNNRLYAKYFTYSPRIHTKIEESLVFEREVSEKDKQSIKSSLFAGLLTIKMFYYSLSEYDINRWNSFIEWLKQEIDRNSDIELSKISFPDNWYETLQLDQKEVEELENPDSETVNN